MLTREVFCVVECTAICIYKVPYVELLYLQHINSQTYEVCKVKNEKIFHFSFTSWNQAKNLVRCKLYYILQPIKLLDTLHVNKIILHAENFLYFHLNNQL